MPKMKTNKAAAKRIKVSARGKLLAHKTGAGHLKSRKSPSQLRSYRKEHAISKCFSKQLRTMLGA